MSQIIPGNGWLLDPSQAILQPTSLAEMASIFGATPDFHVQGDDARDTRTNTDLVQVGTAAENFATKALLEENPPLPMATGTLNFPATGDSWDAPNNTLNDATGSELIAVTFRARTLPGTGSRNILGKLQAGVAGYELRLTSGGKVEFAVQVLGEAIEVVELVGPFVATKWHTVVCSIDRSDDTVNIGGVEEAALEGGNQSSMPLPVGSVTNTETYAIGNQRIFAFDGEVLTATHWRGSKAEGISEKLLARDIAQRQWWDRAYRRIDA